VTRRRGFLLRPKRELRWWGGLALAAYGLAGLLVVATMAAALGPQLESLTALGESVENQRASLVTTLRETSRTLADAGGGLSGFQDSLAQARRSTDRAAILARDVSATMSGIGRAMDVTVFGVQPFAQLAPQFARAGDQLLLLGADLDAIGVAMTRNAGDMQRTRADIDRVQRQVDQLAVAADATRIPAAGSADRTAIRLGVFALAAWIGGLALGCLLFGLALMRSGSRSPGSRSA
jgi:hypothetical protein